MTEIHYCIICGTPFETSNPQAVLCPEHERSSEAKSELSSLEEIVLKSIPEPQVDQPSSTRPSDWQIGDVILDTYEVRQVFTSGGMGLVYRVHHRGWNIDLALKSPRPELFVKPEGAQSFVREAETWVDLGLHPHIVSCYYVRTIDGIPRIFAEYVEGGSLKDWIEDGRLYQGGKEAALERILDIAIQFAWGLQYAHEQGLVHQDVKPANLLMTPEGGTKVSDFGLAKARLAAGEWVGQVGGGSLLVSSGGYTPAYCSPEQAAQEQLSRRTDIWSWALSILEMFTGEVVWMSGVVAASALDNYLEYGAEGKGMPVMPHSLVDLLRECFRDEPKERPKDMLAIAERLIDIYQEETGQVYSREMPKPAALRADSLNNKALTMLDLGKDQEAVKSWQQALEIDPHHAEAMYNLGMWRWQAFQQTDQELVQQLEAMSSTYGDDWLPQYLLGLVHMQRQDVPAAQQALEKAERLKPGNDQVRTAIHDLDSIHRAGHLRTLEEPADWVQALAISPDGRQVISGSWDPGLQSDKALRVWDLASGACLRSLQGHTYQVETIAITQDGQQVISGSADETLRVWDLKSGECLHTLRGHTGGVLSLAVTQNGSQIVSGSEDNTLRVWNLANGECLRTLDGHTDWVEAIVITPDGRQAVSGGRDKTIRLWDIASGECLQTLKELPNNVGALAITPDGKQIVSGSWDNAIRVWDLPSGQCLRTLKGHNNRVNTLAITPDGRLIVSGSEDKTLRVWDLTSGHCLCTLEGHTSWVRALAISPDGRQVISGSWDKTIRLWELPFIIKKKVLWIINRPMTSQALKDADVMVSKALDEAKSLWQTGLISQAGLILKQALVISGFERDTRLLDLFHMVGQQAGIVQGLRMAQLCQILEGHKNEVNDFAITLDGTLLVSGSHKTLRVWDIISGVCLRTFEGQSLESLWTLDITPDGIQMVTGGGYGDHSLRVWDLASGECLRTLEGHTHPVTFIAITPNGQQVISSGNNNLVYVWDLSSGKCLHILQGHSDWVNTLAITPDGQRVISGSNDKTLRMWDLISGKCLRTLRGHTDRIYALAITPNGKRVVSGCGKQIAPGSLDQTLRVWDLERGKCLHTMEGHRDSIQAITITPDGKRVVSASSDKTLRVWDMESGVCLCTLVGHADAVTTLAITPDGMRVISGSKDFTLRLWDTTSGKCLRILEGHAYEVYSLAITPDGRRVISRGGLGMRVWKFDWDYEFPELTDWDEAARPYLETFLDLHTPYAGQIPQDRDPTEEEINLALTRRGKPTWREEDFQRLLQTLGYRGYGWLREEGVRKKLVEMVAERG